MYICVYVYLNMYVYIYIYMYLGAATWRAAPGAGEWALYRWVHIETCASLSLSLSPPSIHPYYITSYMAAVKL